jgi:serine/threonine protein kinase
MRATLDAPVQIGPYNAREGFHFRSIYFGTDTRTGIEVAIKAESAPESVTNGRDPKEVGRQILEYEHSIHSRLNHPRIAKLHDFKGYDGRLYLVTPDLGRETLAHRVEAGAKNKEKLQALEDIADALDYCHQNGIVYIDTKDENVMVRQGRATLIDFGGAREIGKPHPVSQTMLIFTTPCVAPEYLHTGQYSPRSDTFSFALMAYRILMQREPFAMTEGEKFIMYDQEKFHPDEMIEFGDFGGLVIAGMNTEPDARPEIKELRDALKTLRSKRDRQPSARFLTPSPASC